MAQTPDFTKMFAQFGKTPFDATAMTRSQAQLAERMSAVAIEAAQKSTDLSARWMQDALAKFADVTRAKDEAADYAKSMGTFVTTSAESAAEHMAAFAEIAKKVQAETLELLMAAGKDMGADFQKAVHNAEATNV